MTTKTNGERLVRLETDVCYIKEALDTNNKSTARLHNKLDDFITAANDKYSTKEELESHINSSTGWSKSIITWIFSLLAFAVAVYAVIN